MKGSEPPSSSTVFFRLRPARSAMREPVSELPVSVTARMRGSSMSGSIAPPATSTVRSSPCGNPASLNASSIASADRGTFEACLSTAPFPAMNAGAAKRTTCQNGKFHGITARTTPSGSNATTLRRAFATIGSSAR